MATAGFLGTPAYAAPEQWRGAAASPASDVYALGMLLYELLIGFHPYKGCADGRVPPVLLGGELTHRTPIHASLGELVPLALACLSREPSSRPSVSEVVHALRRWTRRHDTVAIRAIRRRTLPIVAAAAAATALAVGGVVYWKLGGAGTSRPSDAGAGKVAAQSRAGTRSGTAPAATVARPAATAASVAPAPRAQIREEAPPRSKRTRHTARKRAVRKPVSSKPEPINLDAPFPPR
jgi:serine/threonine-protein kinase